MKYKRKRIYEKQPIFYKIFIKHLFIVSAIIGLMLAIALICLSEEYNRVVERISYEINNNIDQNMYQDKENVFYNTYGGTEIQDFNEIRTKIQEYSNLLAKKYTEEQVTKSIVINVFSKINFLNDNQKYYPVEIEIYDINREFLCSSEKRESDYYLREKACSKIEYDQTKIKLLPTIHICYNIKTFYSFTYDCRGGINYLTFIAVIIDILLSCIMAITKYFNRKVVYLNYDYRRKVTNAMAHDLKSPLMIISGNIQNIMLKSHEDEEQHFLENILDTTNYMNRTINKSLELFELEEKENKQVELNEFSLNKLFIKVKDKYQYLFDEAKLQIQISGHLDAKADEILMEKIYDNLISNIIRYATKGSKVDIEFGKKQIVMRNEMEKELEIGSEELVQPFVKGDKSRGGQSGSGLGLSIVKQLCELQGFSLKVDIKDKVFELTIRI